MNPEKPFSLHILTQGAGGGHHATLKALQAIAQQQQRPWHIHVIDIDELLAPFDPSKQLFGLKPNGVYNQMVRRGLTWLHPVTMRIDKQLIRLLYSKGVNVAEQHWRQQPSIDLVISLVPLRNQGIWESVQRVKPHTPMLTILTDFADCPPHFWIEPKTKSYILCGTPHAVNQARSLGVSDPYILQTSGLIVHPQFYQGTGDSPAETLRERRAGRQRLGLDPNRMTGIISFGANGCSTMLKIAQSLESLKDRIQIIFLCGSNQDVAQALRKRPTQLRRWVQEFTDDVPYFMHLADFLIGKPGCITISEALVMNLPVIVERNCSTLMNERYTADWIVKHQIGQVIPSFRKIAQAIEDLLIPDNWNCYKANVAAIQNQSIFEVCDIMQHILDTHG
jgi:1,2-diacylglycerol 3-beta-galactosyltransferase